MHGRSAWAAASRVSDARRRNRARQHASSVDQPHPHSSQERHRKHEPHGFRLARIAPRVTKLNALFGAALSSGKFRFLHQTHGAFGKFAPRGGEDPEAQGLPLKGNSHHE